MSRSWSVHPGAGKDAIDHVPGDVCLCGPTTIPLPTADGEVWWLYLHHALTAKPIRDTYAQEMVDWAAQQGRT